MNDEQKRTIQGVTDEIDKHLKQFRMQELTNRLSDYAWTAFETVIRQELDKLRIISKVEGERGMPFTGKN